MYINGIFVDDETIEEVFKLTDTFMNEEEIAEILGLPLDVVIAIVESEVEENYNEDDWRLDEFSTTD